MARMIPRRMDKDRTRDLDEACWKLKRHRRGVLRRQCNMIELTRHWYAMIEKR